MLMNAQLTRQQIAKLVSLVESIYRPNFKRFKIIGMAFEIEQTIDIEGYQLTAWIDVEINNQPADCIHAFLVAGEWQEGIHDEREPINVVWLASVFSDSD